jgi:hypothetical protein
MLKKIKDFNGKDLCKDPEHKPPMFVKLDPGTYEHECPSCGKTQIIDVPLIGYRATEHVH